MLEYTKALVALVAALVAAVATAVGNGSIDDLSGGQWVGIALVVLGGSAATWFAENTPGSFGGAIKAFLAAATAFLTALSVGYENDGAIGQGELLTAVAALLVALTVTYQLRNEPAPVR
jgi:hypothetical protein